MDIKMKIENVTQLLPIQNPLYSFLHNNALQAFEEYKFFEGIYKASLIYQGRTLPSGPDYRNWYKQGVIEHAILNQEVTHYINENKDCPITADEVLLILTHPIKYIVPEWATRKLSPAFYWKRNYQIDFIGKISSWVIPWVQGYLDQGQSLVGNPYTREGLISYFIDAIYNQPPFLRGFTARAADLISQYKNETPQTRLKNLLKKTGYLEEDYEDFLLELCFQIKGWSGMVNRLCHDSSQKIIHHIQINFFDWCSILVALNIALHESLCAEFKIKNQDLSAFSHKPSPLKFEQGSRIINECRSLGIKIKDEDAFLNWFEVFNNKKRYQIWQKALEQSLIKESHEQILKGLNARVTAASFEKPEAIFLFCIDDREESIRRHLEKINPRYKTEGVVGFFGLDMKFKSISHPKSTPQCPPFINPVFNAEETVNDKLNNAKFIRYYHILSTIVFRATRTYFRGLLASMLLGPFTLVNMMIRLFKPEFFFKLTNKIQNILLPESERQIKSNFDTRSKAERVKLICQMANLYDFEDFSKFIFVISHRSTATNNPYRQAYGCGACSGNSGAPNSYLFCEFANSKEVRHELKKMHFHIPENTIFIPLIHDTCSDAIDLVDARVRNQSYFSEIKPHLANLRLAAQYNAQERLRTLNPGAQPLPSKAIKLAFRRSMDLAQPRPEYGHAGVRIAVFGPREWTRHLNLERKAFLVSYDSSRDPDSYILRELLIGALPVCANIGLDYFFSKSDPQELGAGSKLPLNITGLIGVMTGAQSDLRIGLAEQMIDIHIPSRMIIYIDSTPEKLTPIFKSHPRLEKLVFNEWVHIFCVDPNQKIIRRYEC